MCSRILRRQEMLVGGTLGNILIQEKTTQSGTMGRVSCTVLRCGMWTGICTDLLGNAAGDEKMVIVSCFSKFVFTNASIVLLGLKRRWIQPWLGHRYMGDDRITSMF